MKHLKHLAALTCLSLLLPSGVAGVTVRADLEGRSIPLRQVGGHFCHDFDYPRIHCFRTNDALDRAVAPRLAVRTRSRTAETGSLAVSALSYVRVYEHASFAGASAYLSVNYTDLRTIGWNDRISSFSVQNNSVGQFFTDIYYAASSYSFCCNQLVPILDGWNDRFSSVKAVI